MSSTCCVRKVGCYLAAAERTGFVLAQMRNCNNEARGLTAVTAVTAANSSCICAPIATLQLSLSIEPHNANLVEPRLFKDH
jgi:hypothetical protein